MPSVVEYVDLEGLHLGGCCQQRPACSERIRNVIRNNKGVLLGTIKKRRNF
jgi:hypothetical protein